MTGQRHLDSHQCLAVSWGHVVFRAFGASLVCDFSIVTTGRTAAVASTAALGRPSASGLIGRAISWASPTALRSAAPKLAATSSKCMLGAPELSVLGGGQLRCKRLCIDYLNPDPVLAAFEVFLVVRQQRRDALDRLIHHPCVARLSGAVAGVFIAPEAYDHPAPDVAVGGMVKKPLRPAWWRRY